MASADPPFARTARPRWPTRPAGRAAAPSAALRVPARITWLFWSAKLLSTAMGEAISDALVHGVNQYLAVGVGFAVFVVAMGVQFASRRYRPLAYWAAVAAVAIFGTMAADVLHIVLGFPYLASSLLYLVALAVILLVWHSSEGTLSIHSVSTPRREVFYWLTVLATFALGTAVGDLTATTFHLGYLASGLVFIGLFAVPGLAYRVARVDPVLAFWTAYILTRPLGASFADWLGFGPAVGGEGLGHPLTALVFGLPFLALVTWSAVTRLDVPA